MRTISDLAPHGSLAACIFCPASSDQYILQSSCRRIVIAGALGYMLRRISPDVPPAAGI